MVRGCESLTDLRAIQLGLSEHGLHLLAGQAVLVAADGDLLGDARAPLAARHGQDSVRVDGEGRVELDGAARAGRDAVDHVRAQQVVVAHEGPLPLVHLQAYCKRHSAQNN